jgi:hypothetical protein
MRIEPVFNTGTHSLSSVTDFVMSSVGQVRPTLSHPAENETPSRRDLGLRTSSVRKTRFKKRTIEKTAARPLL